MNRKLFSLAGVLIAVVSFTVGSTDAEARHCGRQRNRCCQQNGYQSAGQFGCGQRGNWGAGCGQVRNVGCQQSRCFTTATACCTPQSGAYQNGSYQSGGYTGQPAYGTPVPNANPTPPPVEPAVAPAPAPGV